MNRKKFLAELRSLLSFLDKEDRERALRRYERMFDAVGEEGEDALIREFGSPVRLVLKLEREYREAQKAGTKPFADADAPIPAKADTAYPTDGSEAETEGPADRTPDEEEAEEPFPMPTADPTAEDVYPSQETEEEPEEEAAEPFESVIAPTDALFQEKEPETAAVPQSAEPEELAVQESVAIAEGSNEEQSEESVVSDEKPMAAAPAEPAAKERRPARRRVEDYEEDEEDEEAPGALRVTGAVFVTIPMILFWIVGFVLSVALGALFLALGAGMGAAGVYLARYVLGGTLTFMPDLFLVGGGTLACFALALLLVWMGIWFLIGGILTVIRTSKKLYRKILGRREESAR